MSANDIRGRAAHLLSALDGWIQSESLKPPPYLTREIDAMQAALDGASGVKMP